MSGVQEAVARAICEECGENPDCDGELLENEHRWQDYLDSAQAAIGAYADWHTEQRWRNYWSEME